jgi:hypothetical protein
MGRPTAKSCAHHAHQIPQAAALVVALSLAACVGQLGTATSEFEDDPREDLPPEPPVVVEIDRLGLDGYLANDTPTVIEYRLRNSGPARKVRLELHEWPLPDHVPVAFTVAANVTPLELDLGADEERAGQWILPQFAAYPMHGGSDHEVLLLVRAAGGEVIGATALPEVKTAYWPVAVIAADAELGLEVQEHVHRIDLGQPGYLGRREVALLLGTPPELWYEYGIAGAVILARPWADLDRKHRLALRRYVAFGGSLYVLPDACPDWRDVELTAGAVPGTTPFSHGAGEVFVEPQPVAGEAHQRDIWLARTLPHREPAGPSWDAVQPPLSLVYVMPDAALLVALILGIVVLVGPAAHLVLVRLRRRELAWLVVPGLSVVLAGCMYAVATGVKGEASALEVHYLIQSYGDAEDAAVTTAIRLQSARAGLRTIRAKGDQPRTSFVHFSVFGPDDEPRVTRVDARAAELIDIPMHRFSSKDFMVTFAGRRQPIEIELYGDKGIRVVNPGPGALTDLYLSRPGGWVRLADRLDAGKTLVERSLGNGTPHHEIGPGPPESPEALRLRSLLQAATARQGGGLSTDVVLVAGCETRDPPQVISTPAPLKTEITTTCAWQIEPGQVYAERGEQ